MNKYHEALNQISERINQRIPARALATSRFKRMASHLNTMGRALNGIEAAKGNVTATPAARRDMIREAAQAAFDAVSKSRREIHETAGKVEKGFEIELKEKTGWRPSPFAGELRGAFARLGPGEKVSTVQSWIKDADVGALQSVLDAPGLLTGLSTADRTKYREQFFQAVLPDVTKTRAAYKDLTEHVMAGIKTIEDAAQESESEA